MDITVSPSVPSPAPAVAAAGTPSPDAAGASQFSEAIAAILGPIGPDVAVDAAIPGAVDAKGVPTDPTLLLLAGLLVPGLQPQPVAQPAPTLDVPGDGEAPTEESALLGDLLAGTTPAPPSEPGTPEAGATAPAETAAAEGPTPQIAAQLAAAQLLAAQAAAAQTAQQATGRAAPGDEAAPPTATQVDDLLAASARKTGDAGPAPGAATPAEDVAPAAAQAAATRPQGDLQVKVGGDGGQIAATPTVDQGNRGGGGQGTGEDRREAAARAEGVNAALRGADAVAQAPHADFTAHLKAVHQGPQPPVHALDQIAVKINRAVSDQQDQISFQLRPGDLGRIDVKLEFADGRMRAAIVVENPQTLDLLQRDARSLERALGDAGVKTDAGSLSFSLREDPRQAFAGREDARGGGGGGNARGDEEAEGNATAAAMVASYVRVGNGRVDVRI